MDCKHERIKSVNCEYFCLDCGEKIPAPFIPANSGAKQAEKKSAEEKTDKATAKKTRAKKAV